MKQKPFSPKPYRLFLIILVVSLWSPGLNFNRIPEAYTRANKVPLPMQNSQVFVDPLYGYKMHVPKDWHILPANSDALYGMTVLTNYDENALDNRSSVIPIDAIRIRLGVSLLWEGWSFMDWAQAWHAKESTSRFTLDQSLTVSKMISTEVGNYSATTFDILGNGVNTGVRELIVNIGSGRVMTIMISPADASQHPIVNDILVSLDTRDMYPFSADYLSEFAKPPNLNDLLAQANEKSLEPIGVSAAACPAGTFPGNNAPNAPFTLEMPFKQGQSWVVGGSGSFYGNGAHCNSTNTSNSRGDHYATDWNRSDGNELGEDVFPVANGTIVKSVISPFPTCESGYGCYVVIDHGSNIRTLYAHMSSVYKITGEVKHWEHIGAVGNTGGDYGVHLHLSIFQSVNGSWYSRCSSECATGETPLTPQTVKPGPMNTVEGGQNTILRDGRTYTSKNGGTSGYSFEDKFNNPTLDPHWHWDNEDPSKWSLTASPGNLQIIAARGDLRGSCNNAQNLLLQDAPSGDFDIYTRVFFNPTANYQQGGLLIFVDNDNYIKLDALWRGVQSVEFLQEQQGVFPATWPSINVNLNQPAFLKVGKSGNVYTGSYSADGRQWNVVGSITAASTIVGPKIGLYAFTSTNCFGSAPDIAVDFDFFRIATEVRKTAKFNSRGIYDGWILESTETSDLGGTMDSGAITSYLGDNASNQQYRTILHFNTSALPDNAVITKVVLKIKKQSLVGADPFTTHLKVAVDIRKGAFSNTTELQLTDFQADSDKNTVGLIANNPEAGGWYFTNINATGFPFINLTGITQFRLRFQKDDNNDLNADFMKFYSGNVTTAADRPVLVIEYYVP